MAEHRLHDLDEAMAELEKLSIRTTQGSFVKVEDVKRLLEEKKVHSTISEAIEPKPKDMNHAKQLAQRDPEIAKHFANRPPDAGRSIAAQDPQPASRP